jgi:hypothetical protein
MPLFRTAVALLIGGLLLHYGATAAVAQIPPWLPRYDLEMKVDVAGHVVHVRERVTWINRHERPADEVVFNAHSHYQVPNDDVGFMAKMLEILRMSPGDSLEDNRLGAPLQIRQVLLGNAPLQFDYQETNNTALAVKLPRPIGKNESVTLDVDFDFRLPQKQGRWGQWDGITFLMQWLPVLAVYDEHGWQPTPFIPWHQPYFNEAGIYTARIVLPHDQQVACSAAIAAVKEFGDGWKEIVFAPMCTRDFAFSCSARYREFTGEVGGIQVRCLAVAEHEHYAHELIRWVCEALPVYNRWFGPYPYAQFTIAESYFGWNGNECGGLVMIDHRLFGMPHFAGNFMEYLISHELCHQWWYNAVGTNGYCETWMDEAFATHFSHKLMDMKQGRQSQLLTFPPCLEWLPNIRRIDYRNAGLYGTIGRGDAGPTVQEMPRYGHLVNLLSMCYDRGSKIVNTIEDRMGETAFFDFMRMIYIRYQFKIIRVADFQRELEGYTGLSWDDFFKHWVYGADMVDWCVDKVKLEPVKEGIPEPRWSESFLSALHGGHGAKKAYKATVLLRQKGDYNEATVLGISFDGTENYQMRIPIQPQCRLLELNDPPARVEALSDNCVRVEVVLPCKPTQIAVDPDQVLVDRNPANNYWKTRLRVRWSPIYTPLEETSVTNRYDCWNFTFGLGAVGQAYTDPWYTRSVVLGLRGDLYRTETFNGGPYLGYRTDDRSIVAGVDGLWMHFPWPNTQVGFDAERRLTTLGDDNDRQGDRVAVFGRYIFQYTSSLYLSPMHYLEIFGDVQDHALPPPFTPTPGADHLEHQAEIGLHYHIDYLTPYWDPAGGFRFDASYAGGLPIFGENEGYNRLDAQFSIVKGLPDWLGPLSQTRLAARIYGGGALPNNAEIYTLGGANLFRGFDFQQRQGSAVWVASLEWRIPVVRHLDWDFCDHVGSVRNIYAAPFYDVGNAYVNGHEVAPIAHAVGLGLRVDVAWLALIERTTFRFDVAKTVNSSAPVQFWFGITHPF